MAVLKVAMTAAGVVAGASKPNQESDSYLGNPASANVGTSGSNCVRFASATASALSFPDLIGPMAGGKSLIIICTSPAMSANPAGPPPL